MTDIQRNYTKEQINRVLDALLEAAEQGAGELNTTIDEVTIQCSTLGEIQRAIKYWRNELVRADLPASSKGNPYKSIREH